MRDRACGDETEERHRLEAGDGSDDMGADADLIRRLTTDGRVVETWMMVATHTGEAFGLPPDLFEKAGAPPG